MPVTKKGKPRTTNRPSRGAKVIARLKGSATVKMTTDQILALTRGSK